MALNSRGLTVDKQLLLIGPLVASGLATFINAVTVNNTVEVQSPATFHEGPSTGA